MQYVRLGTSGLKVSRICIGTLAFGKAGWRGWALGPEDGMPVFRRAFELGVNFFDTANYYSDGDSERVLGSALREYGVRDQVVIATKVYRPVGEGPNQSGLSRKHILASVDDSLRRLGTDYIDLFQVHRWDPETPLDETLAALDDVVRAGKVRYVGACTMYAWQLAKALYLATQLGYSKFISVQCHHNLVYRENETEMFGLCREEGIGVLAYSPLARGLLSGGPEHWQQRASLRAEADHLSSKFFGPESWPIATQVQEVARRIGLSPAQLALAWALREPVVSAAILGPSKLAHLDVLEGIDRVVLADADVLALEEIYQPRRPVMI